MRGIRFALIMALSALFALTLAACGDDTAEEYTAAGTWTITQSEPTGTIAVDDIITISITTSDFPLSGCGFDTPGDLHFMITEISGARMGWADISAVPMIWDGLNVPGSVNGVWNRNVNGVNIMTMAMLSGLTTTDGTFTVTSIKEIMDNIMLAGICS